MLILHSLLSPTMTSIYPLTARLTRSQLVTGLIDCGSAQATGKFGFIFVESTDRQPFDLITTSLSSDFPPVSTAQLAQMCEAIRSLIVVHPALSCMKRGVKEIHSSVDLRRILLSTCLDMSLKN